MHGQPQDQDIAERCCPACGATRATAVGDKGEYRVLTCRRCACLYVRPEPTPCQLDEFYREYSYAGQSTTPAFVYEQLRRIVHRFRHYRHSGLLLDVGCGAGEFLQAAQQQGWDAIGLECSSSAVAVARSRGLSVDEGDFLSATLRSDFDVIVMSEVLEHLTNPIPFLRRAFEALRPGGLFYATTPNGRSLSRWVMGLNWSVISPPEHLQLFNVSSLSRALRHSGFQRVWVESRGLNIYALRDYLRPTHRGQEPSLSRNDCAFKLNEQLTRSPLRLGLKELLNTPLRVLRCGDSLRAWAIKPL